MNKIEKKDNEKLIDVELSDDKLAYLVMFQFIEFRPNKNKNDEMNIKMPDKLYFKLSF